MCFFSQRYGGAGAAFVISVLGTGLAFSSDPKVIHSAGTFTYFYEFFAPLFFIHIGMEVDPTVFLVAAGMGLILFVAATAGKLIGVTGPALLLLGKRDALSLGVRMVPRAEIAPLVVYQCSLLGEDVVPDEVFATVVAPPVVRALLRRKSDPVRSGR